MDTNDFFKTPSLPASGSSSNANKRKLTAPTPPVFGRSVVDVPEGAADPDDDDDVDQDNDERREEEFAPGNDADYFVEEDEDGRFFGGGLNSIQKQVLNIMDSADPSEQQLAADGIEGEMSAQGIRKTILAFEKAMNKNREMRTRFSNDPEKFIPSEFILLQSLHSLLPLSTHPLLSYPLLIQLSTPASLADLLAHENGEIVGACLAVLEEWTDEEVLDRGDDDDEDDEDNSSGKQGEDEEDELVRLEKNERERERKRRVMRMLVKGLVDCGVVGSVVDRLARFDEFGNVGDGEEEGEREGVYHTFGLLENLLSLSPALATSLLSPTSSLLPFLLARLQAVPPSSKSKSNGNGNANGDGKKNGKGAGAVEDDQNRFYAAELLAILLGSEVPLLSDTLDTGDDENEEERESTGNSKRKVKEGVISVREGRDRVGKEGGVDVLLKELSVYRKRLPHSADEQEYLSNLFSLLCSILSTSEVAKKAFMAGEGVELCLLLVKSHSPSASSSSKIVGAGVADQAASRMIRVGAIKVLDYAMMGSRVGREVCRRFVSGDEHAGATGVGGAGGLGTLFTALMGKNASTSIPPSKKQKLSSSTANALSAAATAATYEDNEHILSLLSSLLTSLPSDSSQRIRLLAKFVEKGYEKVDRLVELREGIETRLAMPSIDDDGDEDEEDEADEEEEEEDKYLRRLGKGLLGLQLVDYVLAWICMEDDGAKEHLLMLLARKDRSLSDIRKTLVEYYNNLGELVPDGPLPSSIDSASGSTMVVVERSGAEGQKVPEGHEEAEEQREILGHLLLFLEGLDS